MTRAWSSVGEDEAVACVEIPRTDGRGTVRVEARENVGATMAELEGVGNIFGDIARAAKRIAKSRAIARALLTVQKIARHPIIGSVLPPGVRTIVDATVMARRQIVGARRGDQASRAAILRARRAAQRDPRIRQAFDGAQRLWSGC